jgi:hypothetical protein
MQRLRGGVYSGRLFDDDTRLAIDKEAFFAPMIASGLHHHLKLVPPHPGRIIPDPSPGMMYAGLQTECRTKNKARFPLS